MSRGGWLNPTGKRDGKQHYFASGFLVSLCGRSEITSDDAEELTLHPEGFECRVCARYAKERGLWGKR